MVDMNSLFEALTDYRDGTRNLIITGVMEDFDELRKQAEGDNVSHKAVDGEVSYENMPSIINPSDPLPIVYFVFTNDTYGKKLQALATGVQKYFKDFDTIHSLFYDDDCKDPPKSIPEIEEIKEDGKYLGIYKV